MSIKIIKDAAASKVDFVICNRVRDYPIPYVLATIKPCSVCGERCWLSCSSPQEPAILCMQCAEAKKLIAGAPDLHLTESQVRELKAYTGKKVDR